MNNHVLGPGGVPNGSPNGRSAAAVALAAGPGCTATSSTAMRRARSPERQEITTRHYSEVMEKNVCGAQSISSAARRTRFFELIEPLSDRLSRNRQANKWPVLRNRDYDDGLFAAWIARDRYRSGAVVLGKGQHRSGLGHYGQLRIRSPSIGGHRILVELDRGGRVGACLIGHQLGRCY